MPKLTVLGTGWGVRVQAAAFRAAGWDLHAVWGRDHAKALAAQQEHGFAHAPQSWQAAIIGADLVSITTPPMEHRAQTLAALELGVNVLCEKPMALNVTEAQAMVDAVQSSKAWALVDHELRFLPVRQTMRDLIADGFVGTLRAAEVRLVVGARADSNRPFNWWSSRALGGGVLGAIGSHVLDGLRFVLGREAQVTGVRLNTAVNELRDPSGAVQTVDSDDYAALLLDFGGVPVTVTLNAAARHSFEDVLSVHGSSGSLVLRDGLKLEGAKTGQALHDLTPPITATLPAGLNPSNGFEVGTLLLAAHLRDCLERGVRPDQGATLEDGLKVQTLMDEARRLAGWA
jgi:predicted dehydrogenase